ncbi:hypothetical protein [Tumebacillus flagellatus]|uniref:Carrier domain-containing protein n=1 Tax=Tumebacillus flagellatus TaxID=1157490 RepID=A0A074MF58_9BACL|nr:hypothetical protein [Tumebacillus flagellatus]KEO84422.1 hypothetical protein EL26_04790 [Tumebacillus flagellatus]
MTQAEKSVAVSVRERIVTVLQDLGIETDLENELDLAEQFESVTFINAVLDLEREFGISIPDELLNMQIFASLDHTAEIINQLLLEQT